MAALVSLGVFAICLMLLSAMPGLAQRPVATREPKSENYVMPSRATLITIMRAEDERRFSPELAELLKSGEPLTRQRAALAAGRIGDAAAIAPLSTILQNDAIPFVRATAAFALGETELPAAIDPLTTALKREGQSPLVRANIIEALGKIAGAMGPKQVEQAKPVAHIILDALAAEGAKGAAADGQVILKGLTAVLRSKPEKAGPVLVQFLDSKVARIRADAGNTFARLRDPAGNDRFRILAVKDLDPVVRANAVRVLGATSDKASFEILVDRLNNDRDQRVRVAAIRSLAALKDERAVAPLMARAAKLAPAVFAISKSPNDGLPPERNEMLELATSVGNLKQGKDDPAFFNTARDLFAGPGGFNADPEVAIALAKISPSAYVGDDIIPADLKTTHARVFISWQITSALAQGLGAIADLKEETYGAGLAASKTKAVEILRLITADDRLSGNARADLLGAYAAFKQADGPAKFRAALSDTDFVTRAAAASALGELDPDEQTEQALIAALPGELRFTQANDAALTILDALAKQKTETAYAAIKTALDSPDSLVRRRVVTLLADNGQGDFSTRLGNATTKFTDADYARALDRADAGPVTATVTTSKGQFTITLFANEAPMTVDNFVTLAQRKYFDNVVFHRVVPNFVIQTGDPRGDGNGGPGYAIRCEINSEEYDRGAVGMALSGKDTGGSQWFVTHSPQPHLDGGYTVFGRVPARDLPVVDAIARGDRIVSIRVRESKPIPAKRKSKASR
jgi:cyclophilin family peptidyl-prolyl cis-trans isomerase/HEAT repeat protein